MRDIVYGRLSADSVVTALLPGGIWAARSLSAAPSDRPFAVFRMGLNSPRVTDDRSPIASTRSLQVWVHDDEGDYGRIDAALLEIQKVLLSAPSADDLITFEWLSDSEDLWDEAFETIVRFSQYNTTHTRRA